MLLGREPHVQPQALRRQVPLGGGEGVLDHPPGVDLPPVQLELAARNAGEVQEVVDQPRLQLDVPLDHGELAGERRQARIGGQPRDHRQHRGQRCPQLVAEGGEEAVLGLQGLLELAMGFLQGLLRPPALADVEGAAHHPHGVALGVADDQPLVPDVDPRSVAVAQPELGLEGGAGARDGAQDLPRRPLGVAGVDLPAPPVDVPRHLFRPVAEEGEEALGALHPAARRVPVVDQPVDRLGGEAEALLADPQGLLRPPPLGDVAGDEGHARDPASRVADGGDGDGDVDPPAVLVQALGLEGAHPLSPQRGRHGRRQLVGAARRRRHQEPLPHHFGRLEAVHPLRGGVPGQDRTVRGPEGHGVLGGLEDGAELGAGLLGAVQVGDVHQRAGKGGGLAVGPENHLAAVAQPAHGAVRPHDPELRLVDSPRPRRPVQGLQEGPEVLGMDAVEEVA